MAAQNRVSDTVRAVFRGNRTADDTNALSGAGSHAVTSDRSDTLDATRVAGTPRVADTTRPSDDTTVATPVADRTPTLPTTAAPVAAPVAAVGGDAERHRGLGRTGRQQVVAAQQARYGGISWGSAFFGWLSANGMAVILIALLSAGGLAFGLSDAVSSADQAADSAASGIGLGAGIALLVVLFLAYLAGGYVAGRMARFDGPKQGVAVWVIGLVVVVLLALAGVFFGSEYNVLSQLDLPRIPVDEGTATTAGIIALVAVLVVTLVGAVLGGVLGARYHRKVDRVGFDAA
jgi:membrane protease YdiL (CAAX protease family)